MTGSLLSIGDQKVNCSLEYYTPAPGTNHTHGWQAANPCSTAYGFRPMPGVPKQPYGPPDSAVTVYKGKIVQQTHAVINAAAGVELAVRVTAGDASSVQLITKLGPLDISNGYGQEAVMELRAPNIGSAGKFQTDANGLFMMERTRRDNSSGFFPQVGLFLMPIHLPCVHARSH